MQFFELSVHLNEHNLVDSIQFNKNYIIVLCSLYFLFWTDFISTKNNGIIPPR